MSFNMIMFSLCSFLSNILLSSSFSLFFLRSINKKNYFSSLYFFFFSFCFVPSSHFQAKCKGYTVFFESYLLIFKKLILISSLEGITWYGISRGHTTRLADARVALPLDAIKALMGAL